MRAWVHSGALALQLRSYEDALLCFDAALRLSAACVPALLNRAICYHRMGDAPRAEADYTAVIALSPVPAAHRCSGIAIPCNAMPCEAGRICTTA